MFNIPRYKGNINQNEIKISYHPSQNGYYQDHKQQLMLVRLWGKKNPYTLLVGIQISAATMKIKMEFPQRYSNSIYHVICDTTLKHISEGM
jgi:hypothetical protein